MNFALDFCSFNAVIWLFTKHLKPQVFLTVPFAAVQTKPLTSVNSYIFGGQYAS
jgi:hypothetical protein